VEQGLGPVTIGALDLAIAEGQWFHPIDFSCVFHPILLHPVLGDKG